VLPSSAEPLAQCFDHAQIRMIQGAGHLPYEETPEEFNAAAKQFLVSSF
jgi:pimeloyl-ACP methyl ester carboxylesterase